MMEYCLFNYVELCNVEGRFNFNSFMFLNADSIDSSNHDRASEIYLSLKKS
jgi:hypothetical protein